MAFETPIKTLKPSEKPIAVSESDERMKPVSISKPKAFPKSLKFEMIHSKASGDGHKLILKPKGIPAKCVKKTLLRDLAKTVWKVSPPKSVFKRHPLTERECIHGWWC